VHFGAALIAFKPLRDLSDGIWAAPSWAVIVVGGAIAIGAVAAVVGRAVYQRRQREKDERGPRSRRRW
jgi:hypothetical protein